MNTVKALPRVPRLTSLININRFLANPIPVLELYVKTYGDTFAFNLGGGPNRAIGSVNPVFAQHVLQKHHRRYAKSALQTETLAEFIGQGLLTSEGPYWLRQRRLIQPGFHRDKLAALVDIMHNVVDRFLPRFDEAAATDQPLEIVDTSMEMAFRIVAETLFSKGMTEQELRSLSGNVSQLQSFFIRRIRQPYKSLWFRVSGQLRKHQELAKASQRIMLRIIEERRSQEGEHNDLLDMLLSSRYEDTGEGMSDKQLLEESLILFLAGHETSANALAWTFHLLSQHPAVVQRLREEMGTVLEGRRATFYDLPQLHYNRQVIQESMRLYPPAWIMDRVALEDDEVLGYKVPKGTMMVPFIYGIHHSPSIWPDPKRFDPDRFSKEQSKDRPAYAYLPFGGGPRLCIGNNFAMMEMQLVVARLIERYDFLPVEGQKVDLLPLVTLRPRGGILLEVKSRK
ncbi:MAG: cytochrome P450 [Bacteroidota bacterium]